MACVTSLSLNPQTPDAHMDGAIYHPTRNSFFAVRQGYISEYSTALVLLQGPTRFATSIFGRSCIAYDSVNDKVWVGVNNDHGAGYLGDPGNTFPSKSTVGAYRITPSTLAVEQFLDPVRLFAYPSTAPAPNNYGGNCGVYDILVANGKLFLAYWSNLGHVPDSGEGWVMAFALPGVTGSWGANTTSSCNMQLAHDSSNQLWVGMDSDNYNQFFPSYGVDSAAPPNSPNSITTNGLHSAVVFSTVSGGFVYFIEMPNQTLAKYNIGTGNLVSQPALAGATLGGMTSRMRFNPNDNLIYIPCPAANQVIAFNPSTDTVSHIYTTALDSPADVVFAPGGINVAVQQGSQGLVRLT